MRRDIGLIASLLMASEQRWTGRFRGAVAALARQCPLVLAGTLALPSSLAVAADSPAAAPRRPQAEPPAPAAHRPRIDPSLHAARRFLLERARERYEAAAQPGSNTRAELERAIDALGLARNIDPEPWLSFNLAQIYGRLGECARARELYQQLVDAKLGGKLQADTEQALAVLGECDATPTGGNDSAAALSAEQELEPTLRLPASWRLAAQLPLASVQLPPEEHEPRDDAPRGWNPTHAWPWALGSLATLAAGVATGYWWRAASLKNELERVREAGPEVPRLQQRGRSAQNTALVWSGLSAGFALGAAGTYLWLRHTDESTPADVSGVACWGVEGGGVVTYHTRF